MTTRFSDAAGLVPTMLTLFAAKAAARACARIFLGPSSSTPLAFPTGSPVSTGLADTDSLGTAEGLALSPAESPDPEHPAAVASTRTPAVTIATRMLPRTA